MRSYEEKVEDIYKNYLITCGIKYYTKTEDLSSEIAEAFKQYESKNGGKGMNRPDIKYWYNHDGRIIPAIIEAKGKVGYSKTETGHSKCFADIKNYALDGAIHYARAILTYAGNLYPEVYVEGINVKYNQKPETIDDIEIVGKWIITLEDLKNAY